MGQSDFLEHFQNWGSTGTTQRRGFPFHAFGHKSLERASIFWGTRGNQKEHHMLGPKYQYSHFDTGSRGGAREPPEELHETYGAGRLLGVP